MAMLIAFSYIISQFSVQQPTIQCPGSMSDICMMSCDPGKSFKKKAKTIV